MSYIRIKNINDAPYAYLVDNIQTDKGPRQKVKQYLGKVYFLDKIIEPEIKINFSSRKNIILGLVTPELKSRGFKEDGFGNYVYRDLIFDPDQFNMLKRNKQGNFKDVIMKVNEGYICSFTLQQLLKFRASNDVQADGVKLAKYFLGAGLQINQEIFIEFYTKPSTYEEK